MPEYIDSTGKTFGRWYVIEKDEEATKKHGRTYYKCICKCGTKRSVCAKDLRNGKSLSCGCLQKEITSNVCKTDITGERQGRLVAVEYDK